MRRFAAPGERDPYDARTYNLLELYDKVIPRMQTITTKHLSFRIDPAARVAVEKVVAPFLEETYGRYVARYGFEPSGPVVFELYADPDHFAIRTVGLPGIGVEAVCFGRVITSQSPTNGAMNWGMVLAHELAHVFAIELSRSRVPRWFTEGLAELETMRARPEWNRHAERNLWGAMYRGELASLAQLSNGFVRARNAEEATRAYAESALALDFLERQVRVRAAARRAGAFCGRGLAAWGWWRRPPAPPPKSWNRASAPFLMQARRGVRSSILACRDAAGPKSWRDDDAELAAVSPPTPRPADNNPADREAQRALADLRTGDTGGRGASAGTRPGHSGRVAAKGGSLRHRRAGAGLAEGG